MAIHLVRFLLILDAYGGLEALTKYKFFISYILSLFSNFMKTGDSDLLTEIRDIIFNSASKTVYLIPDSIIDRFQLICLRMVSKIISAKLMLIVSSSCIDE